MRLLIATLFLLAASLSGQQNLGCSGLQKPRVTCPEGYHAVYECVCDGPAGPCHWVGACEKN